MLPIERPLGVNGPLGRCENKVTFEPYGGGERSTVVFKLALRSM